MVASAVGAADRQRTHGYEMRRRPVSRAPRVISRSGGLALATAENVVLEAPPNGYQIALEALKEAR
jgi:hypothetical protein